MARSRRSRLAAGLVAGGLVALAVASVVLLSGRDPAPREPSVATGSAARGSAIRSGHHPPPVVCLDVDADLIVVGIDLGLVVGGHHHDCHPPPRPPTITSTTTTTTTTVPPPSPPTPTTTVPPPPPSPPPTTTTTTVPPPPPTTVAVVPLPPPLPPTTSTTTTTQPPPPPPPPPPTTTSTTMAAPLAPRLAVSAAFSPHRPAEGQLATVTLEVRNDGEGPADDVVLSDEVSATTQLRSATSPDGDCTLAGRVPGRTVTCRLGRLDPGEVATVVVRVKVVEDPASSRLVQRVSLGSGGQVEVAERSFSALVDPGSPRGLALLDLPGPTVTVVALVTFVLAARPAP